MVRREVLKRRKEECDIGQHTYFDARGGFKVCEVCGLKADGPTQKVEAQTVKEDLPQHDIKGWKQEFQRHLDGCASSGLPFTSEHLILICGPPPDDVQVNVEEMMLIAARREVIKETGKKRGLLTEWTGV